MCHLSCPLEMNCTEAISYSSFKKLLAESVRSWFYLFHWSYAGLYQLRIWWIFPWIFHKSLHIQYFGNTYLWMWIKISDCVVFEICCVWKDSRPYLSNICRCILAKTPWKWCCSYLWFWSGTFTEMRIMPEKFWTALLPSDFGSVRKVIFQWKKKQLCHFIQATGAINPPKWLFANSNVW